METKDVDPESVKKKEKMGRKKRRQSKSREKFDSELKKKAQEQVKDNNNIVSLKEKRDEYNERTKNLIKEHKQKDEEFKQNRDHASQYKEKRDELNEKVRILKEKRKNAYDKITELNEELKDAKKKDQEKKKKEQENKKNENYPNGKRAPSLRKIKTQIRILEQKIITDNLEIKEENEIINQIQDLEQIKFDIEVKSGNTYELRTNLKEISTFRSEIKKINNEIQDLSDESQNFHVLMMEFYKDNDVKRKELERIRKELRESKVIADEYHNKFRELSAKQRASRKSSDGKFRSYKGKQIQMRKIKETTLNDALKKKKDGKKLNIFEARALFESSLDENK